MALLGISRLRGITTSKSVLPVMTVIPRPTATTPPLISPTVTESLQATPSPIPAAPKQLAAGELVEVFGTEGEGLRIRENPSLAAEVMLLGLESEVFEVVDGPVDADGYIWWRLANPFDPTKQGWAVDQFLRSLEGSP